MYNPSSQPAQSVEHALMICIQQIGNYLDNGESWQTNVWQPLCEQFPELAGFDFNYCSSEYAAYSSRNFFR